MLSLYISFFRFLCYILSFVTNLTCDDLLMTFTHPLQELMVTPQEFRAYLRRGRGAVAAEKSRLLQSVHVEISCNGEARIHTHACRVKSSALLRHF